MKIVKRRDINYVLFTLVILFIYFPTAVNGKSHWCPICKDYYQGLVGGTITCGWCGKKFNAEEAIFSRHESYYDYYVHIYKCPNCGHDIGSETFYKTPTSPSPSSYSPKENPLASCFIATAAFGTPFSEEVEILREFRDVYLLSNPLGQLFVSFYYKISPPIAHFISKNENRRAFTRTLLYPITKLAKFLLGKR